MILQTIYIVTIASIMALTLIVGRIVSPRASSDSFFLGGRHHGEGHIAKIPRTRVNGIRRLSEGPEFAVIGFSNNNDLIGATA